MAKKDYRKLTVTSQRDPASGGLDISRYESDIRSIVNNAVKSALNEGEFFYVGDRRVDPVSGITQVDIYVHPDKAGVTESSIGSQIQKLGGGSNYTVTRERVSKEERDFIAREERGKTESETTRFNKGMLLKLAGTLFTIADIVRRILSAVTINAKQTVRDAVTAHNLGTSLESVRQYKYIEQAHGLKEGTITGALSTIQGWFGNITKLDESALEDLAVVMGGEIEKMALMGLGASNPEKIMEAIINAFNKRAEEGVTSTGKYVGEQDARRELYSYLLRLSPELADVFAKMQEEQNNINSIYRNFKDYVDWKSLTNANRGDKPNAMINVEVTTGELANKVESILTQIKQGLMLELDPMVIALLRRLSNLRWGLSASENAEMNRENNKANEDYLVFLNKTLAGMDGKDLSTERKGLKVTLEKEKEKVEKEIALYNKGDNVANLTRTISELEVEGAGNTQAILAFDAVGSKFTSEEARALIKKAIDERLPTSTINEEREKLVEGEESNLQKKKLRDKKRLYNDLYKRYTQEEGLSSYYANKKIAEDYPELLEFGTETKKGLWGKEYTNEIIIPRYKELTEEESNEIKEQAEANISDEDLYDFLFRRYANKLDIGAYQVQEARERIKNIPEASLMALYALGETPDSWQDKVQKLPLKNTYDYKVLGVNERTASGEVIHKIVLDVNANGEIDKEDKVLGTFMGYEGYSGLIGTAHANIEGKRIIWNIETEGTEASVQAPKKK